MTGPAVRRCPAADDPNWCRCPRAHTHRPAPGCPTYAEPAEPAGVDAARLLAEYDAWRQDRADLSADVNAESDDWHASDDAGCDLAARLADALRATLSECA